MLCSSVSIPESRMAETKARADLLINANRRIGIDAFNIGEMDLALGKDYLLSHSTQTTILSANILEKGSKKPIFQPFVIKEISGVRVGIFGVIDSGLSLGPAQEDFEIEDTASSARKAVADLKRENADFIIGLTHLNPTIEQRLAQDVEGIDIIFNGHSGMKLDKPSRAGKTVICQAYQRGQYLGRLDLILKGKPPYSLTDASEGKKVSKRESSYVNSLIPMGMGIKSEPDIDKLVQAYKDEAARLQREMAAQVLTTPTLKYRGEESCRKCHAKIAQFQEKTKHARAFGPLLKKNKQLDPQCIGCHTTGFQKPGGFSLPFMVGTMRNVQCEACHGPAMDHIENPLKSKPFTAVTRETCTACHTQQWDPKFNFKAKLPRVSCKSALAPKAH